ncbi:MAG: hypothetical protein M3Z66_25515 [Chloroflexota bacterium]|nr:hypothetical protein [Chloroflexota bacterium]
MELASTASLEREGLGYIVVTYRVHPEEGGEFGAECVELGIRTCGDSVGAAFDAVAEATLLYLNSLERHGERTRVFTERGIDIICGEPGEDGVERTVPLRPSEYIHSDTIQLPASVA